MVITMTDLTTAYDKYQNTYKTNMQKYTRIYDEEHSKMCFLCLSQYPFKCVYEDYSVWCFGNPHIKWLLNQMQLKILGLPFSVATFIRFLINDMLFIISVVPVAMEYTENNSSIASNNNNNFTAVSVNNAAENNDINFSDNNSNCGNNNYNYNTSNNAITITNNNNNHRKASYSYNSEISFCPITTLCPLLVASVVGELNNILDANYSQGFRCVESVVSGSKYLRHLGTGGIPYPQRNFIQRLVLLGLMNFSAVSRSYMISDKLFQKILNSESLLFWIIGCNNAGEQTYLNTCNTAAYNQSLVTRSPVLSCLLYFAQQIICHIRDRVPRLSDQYPAYRSFPFTNSAPSIQYYVKKKIDSCQQLLTDLYNQALSLVDSSSPTMYIQIVNITKQWGSCMQTLSSVYFPNWPCPLTTKLVRNNWHMSAWLTTLGCLVTWFLPTQPTLLSRTRGTLVRYPQIIEDSIMSDPAFNSKLPAQRMYNNFAHVIRTNQEDTNQLLDKMWRDVWEKGGVLLRTSERIYCVDVGHLNFLRAILHYGTKAFVMMDPEVDSPRLLYFDDLYKLIMSETSQFDFFEFT